MHIATPTEMTKQINHMRKDFLWGFNKEARRRKTPLVVWKRLTQPWDKGGLGFKDGGTHAQALLSKWVTKVLDDSEIEWAQLFMALTNSFSWEHKCLWQRVGYTIQDKFLQGNIKSYGAMKYLTSVWKSWLQLWRHLILTLEGHAFPARWRIADVIRAMQPSALLDNSQALKLEELMRKIGITTIFSLWEEDNHFWKPLEDRIHRVPGLPKWLKDSAFALLDIIQATDYPSFDLEVNPSLWEWTDCSPTTRTFQVSNKIAYSLMLEDTLEWRHLDQQCGRQDGVDRWQLQWKKLWGCDLTRRAKIFI